jgi:hypothetical protein
MTRQIDAVDSSISSFFCISAVARAANKSDRIRKSSRDLTDRRIIRCLDPGTGLSA